MGPSGEGTSKFDRMEANIKTPKKSLQQKLGPKKFHAELPSLRNHSIR